MATQALMRKGSVAIVGCGWLGAPLAEHLLQAGYDVYGSTTTEQKLPELRSRGIRASVVQLPLTDLSGLTDTDSPSGKTLQTSTTGDNALWQAEQLVLTIPPGRGDEAETRYPAAILSAILQYRRMQPAGRIIMTSSTGIYGNARGHVNEQTIIQPTTARARTLVKAEAQLQTQAQRPHVILRLGGLYGGDRHPGRYLAGRQNVPDGDAPVNMVNRERVITKITELLDEPFWTQSLHNVVDVEHPSKRDFYTAFALAEGLQPPTFLEGGGDGKVVGSC